MKTKNMLLLIVAVLITMSSASAQYIENDTRFDEGAVKATKTMFITTSIEPELLDAQITTTSVEPELSSEDVVTTDAELELYNDIETTDATPELINEDIKATDAVPELYDDVMVTDDVSGNNFELLYWIAGIAVIMLLFIFFPKKDSKS